MILAKEVYLRKKKPLREFWVESTDQRTLHSVDKVTVNKVRIDEKKTVSQNYLFAKTPYFLSVHFSKLFSRNFLSLLLRNCLICQIHTKFGTQCNAIIETEQERKKKRGRLHGSKRWKEIASNQAQEKRHIISRIHAMTIWKHHDKNFTRNNWYDEHKFVCCLFCSFDVMMTDIIRAFIINFDISLIVIECLTHLHLIFCCVQLLNETC